MGVVGDDFWKEIMRSTCMSDLISGDINECLRVAKGDLTNVDTIKSFSIPNVLVDALPETKGQRLVQHRANITTDHRGRMRNHALHRVQCPPGVDSFIFLRA